MVVNVDERVRFLLDSRNGDWKKNDLGTIERVLALPPQNQFVIYIVKTDSGLVWATDKDVEVIRQMTIFDALATVSEA